VQNADIAALWDAGAFNAGFLVVRPSALSQQLYQTIRQMTSRRRRIDDQRALNRAIRMMKKDVERGRGLRVNVLDRKQFMSGVDYFEKSGRMFPRLLDDGKPSRKLVDPLVVHNNWIVGKEAKIYRFREHLMWLYDGSNQYYSSETRRYLTYTNPKPTTSSNITPKNVVERELSALRSALAVGHLLNRVVILPRFHCGVAHRQCPVNSVIHIKTFDSIFSGRYRESSFLRHPKVPESVKQGVTDRRFSLNVSQTSDVLVAGTGVITRLFGELRAKVLNITNLLQVKIDTADSYFDHEFTSKLQSAFRRSRYRQVH